METKKTTVVVEGIDPRRDVSDLLTLARIYLRTRRCKKCQHLAQQPYCCDFCGDDDGS